MKVLRCPRARSPRLRPSASDFPARGFCIPAAFVSLPVCVSSVSTAASQKKGAVSYCFKPMLRCPPLAALSDDQREEFKPRWQRNMRLKQLETAPFLSEAVDTDDTQTGRETKAAGIQIPWQGNRKRGKGARGTWRGGS